MYACVCAFMYACMYVQDQFKSGDQCKKRFTFCRNIPPMTGSSTHHEYRVEADKLHHIICAAARVSSIGDTPGNDDDVTEIGDEFDTTQDDKEEHVRDMTADKKHLDENDPYTRETSYDDFETAPTQPESPLIHIRTASHTSSSGLSTAIADLHVSAASPCPSPSSTSDTSCSSSLSGTRKRKHDRQNQLNTDSLVHSPQTSYRVSAKRKDDTNIETTANKQRRHTATAIDNIMTSNNTRAESAESFQRMLLITMQQERQEAREREERREQRDLEYKREIEERRLEEKRREDLRQEQQERQHREFMIALFATITGKTLSSNMNQTT